MYNVTNLFLCFILLGLSGLGGFTSFRKIKIMKLAIVTAKNRAKTQYLGYLGNPPSLRNTTLTKIIKLKIFIQTKKEIVTRAVYSGDLSSFKLYAHL